TNAGRSCAFRLLVVLLIVYSALPVFDVGTEIGSRCSPESSRISRRKTRPALLPEVTIEPSIHNRTYWYATASGNPPEDELELEEPEDELLELEELEPPGGGVTVYVA